MEKHIRTILEMLSERYPVVKTQLEHDTPFQLLIATILAAQCTDGQVNKVTRKLFEFYPDPATLAAAPLGRIKQLVFSTGFYNNKAKNIKACAGAVMERFGGQVPGNIEQLVELPGVGRKTANVVLSVCFGKDTIVVDTHVLRISNRLGIINQKDPVKAEFDLMKCIPRPLWNDVSLQLIYFGRDICQARKPNCGICPVFEICPAPEKKINAV